ncbi:ion channel [Marinisporobacter balticus]|uniref:Pentapeptide repeat protein n=1 Tax=Marinisporobacter balticus TaxID=2018667 RepID=A0A4R2KZP3_9FIRM|nr:ion channel [Marinisporobacter balticus]TCO79413.1 pentapeptide repeat protein [Marinisporobacter balticus]
MIIDLYKNVVKAINEMYKNIERDIESSAYKDYTMECEIQDAKLLLFEAENLKKTAISEKDLKRKLEEYKKNQDEKLDNKLKNFIKEYESTQYNFNDIKLNNEYTKYVETIFFQTSTGDELKKKEIRDDFTYCKFIRTNCISLKFVGCSFSYVDFFSSQFFNIEFVDCKFNNSIFLHSEFREVRFINCTFNQIVASNTKVKNCKFEHSDIFFSKFLFNTMFDLKMLNCKIKDTDFVIEEIMSEIYINNIEIDSKSFFYFKQISNLYHKSLTKLFFLIKPQLEMEVCKNISRLYKSLSHEFQKNNYIDKYGYCFYLGKLIESGTERGLHKVYSLLAFFVCGYGELPWNSLIASFIIIFIFSFIYLYSGVFDINYDIFGSQHVDTRIFLNDLAVSLHFSIVTFTTVGYGNIYPTECWGLFFSALEMIIGVIMIAIWTSSIVRKMLR